VKRPEVIERMKKKHNQHKYDGNRDLALENANHQCEECGISQTDHFAKYGKDLYVYHIDGDPKNNDLNNLKPLCMSCSVKRTSANR
jgi:5-methylcytosine-specific restriction endonuclease McrA